VQQRCGLCLRGDVAHEGISPLGQGSSLHLACGGRHETD
jgi:hypothetical protein